MGEGGWHHPAAAQPALARRGHLAAYLCVGVGVTAGPPPAGAGVAVTVTGVAGGCPPGHGPRAAARVSRCDPL